MALTHRKKRPIDRNLEVVGDTRLLIIATEGRKTEKQQFRNRRVQVKVIPTGEDNKSSPEYILRRLKYFRQEYDLKPNDELWLMIDVDRSNFQGQIMRSCWRNLQNIFKPFIEWF